jgi:Protein of unknown function (DUF2752)
VPQNRSTFRSWALAGLVGLAGAVVLHFWVPLPGAQHSFCFVRRLTGIPCPGCGMSRAFAHLAKGEWAAAARDHPLAYLLAAEAALVWLAWGGLLARRRPVHLPAVYDRVMFAHVAVFVAFWLGRAATGTLPW